MAALPDFSLILGGPLYQLLLRARMQGPAMELLERRVIAAVLITWIPLVVLTGIGGGFLGGVNVPLIYDLDVHARFLLALPLLIAAEVFVHRGIHLVVDQFRERNLLAPEDHRTFEAIIAGAMRLRNSVLVEIVLLVFAFTGGYWLWRTGASLHVATWYGHSKNGTISFTWAGYWYVFFSIPLFRFILLRWYFRIFIWYVFLFRVARLQLRLNPLHPDRAGGLGFLGFSADAISPVLIAQTIYLSAIIATHIWHDGATLPDFQMLIGGVVGFFTLIVLVPLCFFVFQMTAARIAALREYGGFAASYVGDFRQKWLAGGAEGGQEKLGSGDIQSLADLSNSFEVVAGMRVLPFGKELVIRVFVLVVVPFLPLALTMFPFEQLLKQLVGLVL